MADDPDDLSHPARSSDGGSASAAAMAALGAASREKADAYLEKQSALADLQMEQIRLQNENLLQQDRYEISHLRFRRFGDYSKMGLEIAAGLLLLTVVCGLGAMIWNAAHDHDLTIEAFSVPPDIAARGFTGQTVAVQLLDNFAAMEAKTLPTAQAQGTYRLDASDTIKIAIPDTGGLSLGEIDRYLRDTLGHETHVSGELMHTPQGIAVTMRASGKPGRRFDGTEADLDGLMQKAAEALFQQSEPLRYADYLADRNRFGEAVAVLRPMSLTGSPLKRARALTSWAEALDFDGNPRAALPIAEEAIGLAPKASFAWAVDSDIQIELGQDEAAHTAEATMIRTAPETWSSADLASSELAYLPFYIGQRRYAHEGDFAAAAEAWNRMFDLGGSGLALNDAIADLLERVPQLAAAHDLSAARRLVVQDYGLSGDPPRDTAYANAVIAFYASDWQAVVNDGALLELPGKADPYNAAWRRVQVQPLRAIAMAHLGDFAGADAMIEKTPVDCDLCARARAQIAALKHDRAAAARWFALVSARTPSIPFSDTDWGQMLLQRGDDNGAIAKFALANQKGPHFADPLEMWGEALIAKNRSDLALVKFAEAEKYAPNWGRLRLKWGEALWWSGDHEGAQKQLAIAAALDLTPSEKSELAKMQHG